MDEKNVFEFYLKQISSLLGQKNFNTCLDLCREMRTRLLDNPPVDPVFLGWQRFYQFLTLVQLHQDKEALDLFLSKEEHPFTLDHNQITYMTSVAAEIACADGNAGLTLRLSRLAWTMSFKDPDIISRVQKAQNACIYFERIKQNQLNFGFARFLTGFGKSNDIPVLFVQGLECLLANYNQSSSLTVAALLLNSLPELAGYLESLPDNLDRLRLVELVDAINRIPGTINCSGQFEKACSLLAENKVNELTTLLNQHPQLVDENDKSGMTLLFKAIQHNNPRAVELLIEKGADLHRCEGTQGASPLLMAVNLGNPGIVHQLLEAGADPEIKGIFGQTPIMRAVIEEHPDIAAMLLEYGVLLDRRDESSNTALMYAVETGHIEMARSLIFAGADPLMKNEASMSLLQIAESSEQEAMAKFLRQLKIQ